MLDSRLDAIKKIHGWSSQSANKWFKIDQHTKLNYVPRGIMWSYGTVSNCPYSFELTHVYACVVYPCVVRYLPMGLHQMDISYSPWNMMTSGDRHQGCGVQVQDENQEDFICLKLSTHMETMVKWRWTWEKLSHIILWGSNYKSSPSKAHSRKMVQLEMIKIVVI